MPTLAVGGNLHLAFIKKEGEAILTSCDSPRRYVRMKKKTSQAFFEKGCEGMEKVL